jgi:hypothetical protein
VPAWVAAAITMLTMFPWTMSSRSWLKKLAWFAGGWTRVLSMNRETAVVNAELAVPARSSST